VLSEAGCLSCHTGPRGTDAAWVDGEPVLHDVGTLTDASGQRMGSLLVGLRTPPLLGLHHSGPWLHDGSAATLQDAIDAHALLNAEQMDAVLSVLEGFGG
jgi:cytochrome c peroxidase